MDKRKLGRSDLATAPVVFGCNVFGWTLNESESFKMLDEFFGNGFNAVDTADVYSYWVEGNSGGESETILGNWMKQRNNRDEVLLITKVGSGKETSPPDLTEKHIIKSCDESLRRLQTDTIDLYLTHWDDLTTPVEETLNAYKKLIDAGKVRYIGASNLSPERLQASLDAHDRDGLPRYEVFQPEYNLYDRSGYENGVAEICQKNEIGVITYYPMASGFLSGKYRSREDLGKSVRGSGVEKYLNDRGFQILAALDKTAEKHSSTPAAVSLAWQLHSPLVTAPISSGTKSEHIHSFKQAAELKLDSDDIALLNNASK